MGGEGGEIDEGGETDEEGREERAGRKGRKGRARIGNGVGVADGQRMPRLPKQARAPLCGLLEASEAIEESWLQCSGRQGVWGALMMFRAQTSAVPRRGRAARLPQPLECHLCRRDALNLRWRPQIERGVFLVHRLRQQRLLLEGVRVVVGTEEQYLLDAPRLQLRELLHELRRFVLISPAATSRHYTRPEA